MQNILISSAGRRVSLLRAFQKELIKAGYNGSVIACDASPQLSAACNAADDFFKVPRLDDETYIEKLLDECKNRGIKLVIPTIDTELLRLAESKEKFKREGIEVVISSPSLVKKCRDKFILFDYFEEFGLRVPVLYSKENYEFPLFIKPKDGSSSIGIHLVYEKDNLDETWIEDPNNMLMEYLAPSEWKEYTIDLYYDRYNSLKCVVPRKRIEVRAGEVSKGITIQDSLTEVIKSKLSHIPGAVGCLTFQLFRNENTGEIKASEINPRFGGGFPLSYEAGANFPGWLIKEYLQGGAIDYFNSWKSNLLMLRYDEGIFVNTNGEN